jgi:hypothetical protein
VECTIYKYTIYISYINNKDVYDKPKRFHYLYEKIRRMFKISNEQTFVEAVKHNGDTKAT